MTGPDTSAEQVCSPSVEQLAQDLHEAGREAVARQLLANPSGRPFIEWADCPEEVREGRRVQARHLLALYPGLGALRVPAC